MNPSNARESGLQGELDKEQATADLDQGIADREQARADREQAPIDAAQRALDGDGDGDVADGASPTAKPGQPRSRVALNLEQDRHDAYQAQLDDTQRGRSLRQDVIDQQQAAPRSNL